MAAVYVIGNFDGVHLGHQELVRRGLDHAQSLGSETQCIALTFWPHPQAILKNPDEVQLLLSIEDRKEHLLKLGVSSVIILPFTRDFADLPWNEFVDTVLLSLKPKPKTVFVGEDFRFGKNREGTAKGLRDYLSKKQIQVELVKKKSFSSEDISSTRIRSLLLAGKVEEANQLLGYPYYVKGLVARGEGRGAKMGFPTANLEPENLFHGRKVLPKWGVYVTSLQFDQKTHASVSNVGVVPTFQAHPVNEPLIETYVLKGKLDLYGCRVSIQFHKFLREEQKFDSATTLKTQIEKDCAQALDYWKARPIHQ